MLTYLYESKTTLENLILKDAEQRNLMVINRRDSYVTDRTVDLINLADSDTIEQYAISSNIEFQKMSNPRQFIEGQNVTWMSVPIKQITPIMKNIIENLASDRLREVVSKEKVIYNNDVFGRLLVANSYGADIAATIKPDDYDQFTDAWWTSAKENGLYLGGITYDKASGFVTIPTAVRMNDNNGNFVGVIKGTLTLDNIFKIISNQMESAKLEPLPSEYKIIDGTGKILFSTHSTDKPFVDSLPTEIMLNIKGQSGHFFQNDEYSGLPELITYARSTSSQIDPTANWAFIVEYDRDTALKPVTDMIDISVIIMIISIPSVIIVVFYVSKKIENPINKISFALNEFVNGNDINVNPVGTDETKELGTNFNQMIERIRKNEKAINESEETYRALFDSAPIAIALSDKNLNITSINNRFLQLFKYQHNEIIGKSVSTIIADKSLEQFRNDSEFIDHNKIDFQNKKYLFKKKDMTTFPALVNVKSAHMKGGEFIAHIAMIKDISELEEAEEKIIQHEKNLEEKLKQLSTIDRQKTEFSSMISHELTTPLFPIKFHAEMLKDYQLLGKLNKEQNKSVDEIYQNSIKLEKLISDILDAQKIEMGNMKFSKKIFDVNEFMEKISSDNSPFINEKSIQFVNATSEKLQIDSDPDRLSQVFSNLIKNSIDFVNEETGKIEIGANSQGTDVLFYVKDNGIGIPHEKQNNLFKKFYQIDTSITRKHRGSGLGLAICKGIVEGLNGKIWIESTVGLGTIVYFSIPKNEIK